MCKILPEKKYKSALKTQRKIKSIKKYIMLINRNT